MQIITVELINDWQGWLAWMRISSNGKAPPKWGFCLARSVIACYKVRLSQAKTDTRFGYFPFSSVDLKSLGPKLAAADVHGIWGVGHEVAHAPFREADLEAPFHYSSIGIEIIDQQKVLVSKLRIWAEPKVPCPGMPLRVKVCRVYQIGDIVVAVPPAKPDGIL